MLVLLIFVNGLIFTQSLSKQMKNNPLVLPDSRIAVPSVNDFKFRDNLVIATNKPTLNPNKKPRGWNRRRHNRMIKAFRLLPKANFELWTQWSSCKDCKQHRRRRCKRKSASLAVCYGIEMKQKRFCNLTNKRCKRRKTRNARRLHNLIKKSLNRERDSNLDSINTFFTQDQLLRRKMRDVQKANDSLSSLKSFDRRVQDIYFMQWSPWSICRNCRKRRFRKCKKETAVSCYLISVQERRRCYSQHSCINGLLNNKTTLNNFLHECGKRSNTDRKRFARIVGGSDFPGPGYWPWQVSLLSPQYESFCGGVLLSSRWVLSAAHCLKKFPGHRKAIVRLGEHNMSRYERTEFDNEIDRQFIHPDFDTETIDSDIGLIKLKNDVKLSKYIKPACLPIATSEPETGTMCTVAGWGKRNFSDLVGSSVLHHTAVPLVATDTCQKSVTYSVTVNQLCAGHVEGGKDACEGDSGSGLLCPIEKNGVERWYITGITSFGESCGQPGKYGIYTKVSNFIDWILMTMNTVDGSLSKKS